MGGVKISRILAPGVQPEHWFLQGGKSAFYVARVTLASRLSLTALRGKCLDLLSMAPAPSQQGKLV